MSKENVQLFFKKVQNDEALQAKIKSLLDDNQKMVQEGIIKLGAESGYPFSPEDLQQIAKETARAMKHDGELDDTQLEAVAGGSTEGWVLLSILSAGIGCAVSGIMNCEPEVITR